MPFVKSWLVGIFDDIEFFEFGSSKLSNTNELVEVVMKISSSSSLASNATLVLCKDYIFCSNISCSFRHDYNRDYDARQRFLKKNGLDLWKQKNKLSNARRRFPFSKISD